MQNVARSFGMMLLGLAIGATWLTQAVGQPETGLPPTANPELPTSELPPGCLQVVAEPGVPITAVVYDPQQQVLGVYHVDRSTGEIELRSIRQIQWDLQLLHYDTKKPLPQHIKNNLEAMRAR